MAFSRGALLMVLAWLACGVAVHAGKGPARAKSPPPPTASSPPPPPAATPPPPSPYPPASPPAAPVPTGATTISCNNATVSQLYTCLKAYMHRFNEMNDTAWAATQPAAHEVSDLQAAVAAVLSVTSPADCASSLVSGNSLQNIYAVQNFTASDGRSYCVLHEKYACTYGSRRRFCRGWPLFLAPSLPGQVSRTLHLSAAHPIFDMQVGEQGAYLLAATGARSLLVAGSHRNARNETSPCQPSYLINDAAHSDQHTFQAMAAAVRSWQLSPSAGGGGCLLGSCAFIQLHGFSSTECPGDTFFMSAGTSVHSFYTNATNPRAALINRLAAELEAATGWNASTPATTRSNCSMTGNSNTFGRLVNDVPADAVCGTAATSSTVTGLWIHVEQKPIARNVSDPIVLAAQAAAYRAAIPCTCANGYACDVATNLCTAAAAAPPPPPPPPKKGPKKILRRLL